MLEGVARRKGRLVLQHPFKVTVEVRVHALHILQGNLLPQDHLVEGSNEESI